MTRPSAKEIAREDTHCYLGTMPCGCTVACVVDMVDLPKSTAKSVGEFIKRGYTVSRCELSKLHDGSVRLARCVHQPEGGRHGR